MEDTLVCPICETENAPDATHCEVCGERLVPAGPGEDVAPEENVAAEIASEAEVVGLQAEDSEPQGFEAGSPDQTADFDAAAFADEYDSEPHSEDEGVVEDEGLVEDTGEGAEDVEFADEEVSEANEAPAFLYSPIDGTAYPAGSAEYEEGFGPEGEELLAHPPEQEGEAVSEAEQDFDGEVEEQFESEGDVQELGAVSSEGADAQFAAEIAGARPAGREPSAEFRSAFQVRSKQRPAMQPLPQPGAYTDPATLTVYVNRQPVARHAVETDEVLIGRRDPVADAYPDLDLTEFDAEAVVSRKHAYVYRQNKNYTLYAVSNAGTQLNSELLNLGDRRPLKDGDVVVLAGKIAMKFEIPGA